MNTLKILKKSVREYKRPTILTPTFIIGEVVLETLIPLIMAELIDTLSGNSMTPILKYGFILLAMAVISLLCGELAGRFAAEAACGFSKNLRKDLYYKLQDFSFADIDKFSTSSLITRMTTDVNNVEQSYQILIRLAIRVPLMLIFSFIFSFRISWKLSLIFVAALPVLALCLFALIKTVFPLFRKIFKKYDNMNESVQENVQSIRVVKSFVREDYEKDKFEKASGSVRKDFTRAEKIIALNGPLMFICIYTVISLIVYFGAKSIVATQSVDLTTGELSALIGYAIQIMISILMFSMVFVVISISAESANRIKEVLSTVPQFESPENGVKVVENGDIEFSDVSFKYSEKAEKNALSNINLTIKSGETVGILGATGSSKSTLVQLIPRLYDVSDGTLKVGGVNVKDYDLAALRDSVAMVLQKNVLFAGTIKDNIRWGKEDATDDEIREVCRLACADEFIADMPDGYDTFIEQGGANVSGGQKQRLCIARALIKHPKILILDDSTSAVDTNTDAKIRKAFLESIPDTTKIIISQRVASVSHADKIIIMDGGGIAAAGTHDELLNTNSIYREVYESQTKSKEGGIE